MLLQILAHTPVWVAALFAALLWLGGVQMRTRPVSLGRVIAVPTAMTGLSVYGVTSAFGPASAAVILWVVVAAAVAALVARWPLPSATRYDKATHTFQVAGSVVPLAVMMGIFFTKYTVGVQFALHPELARDFGFSLAIGVLYGAFGGFFAGRAVRLWILSRRADPRGRDSGGASEVAAANPQTPSAKGAMRVGSFALIAVTLGSAVMAGALTFGGPTRPKAMHSISSPFKDVDFSALPSISRYPARDGAQLAYRRYSPPEGQAGRGSVVLVHGSSASGASMHPLAQSFAKAGFTVYALDIRGHGDSGPRGEIAYVGQLDDDLADFMHAVQPAGPKTLVGFSAGGGFAIRVAGGARQDLFDDYLFMAPYTSRSAPNYRPDAGGWISIGIPRLIALRLLNRIGVTGFNHLRVVAFAVEDSPHADLAPWYSYALMTNFQPDEDYQRNIRDIHEPAAVLVGANDEVFIADRFKQVFADAGRPDIAVTLVPGAGHITLTLAPAGRAAAVSAVERLDTEMPSSHL